MSTATTVSTAVHLLTGAVWAGAIVFVVSAVLPAARAGEVDAAPLGSVASTLRNYSRAAAVLLLLTGGHLAWANYDLGSLTGSGRGHLVLTMVGLWFVATGLVEVGTGKLVDGTDRRKVREPAREAERFLQATGLLAALVLVVSALLITDV